MSSKEILWRLSQLGRDAWEYWFRKDAAITLKKCATFRPLIDIKEIDIESCRYFWEKNPWHESVLDALKKNQFSFIFDIYDLGSCIDWHYDPTTGARLPLIYGRRYLFRKMYHMANMQFVRALNRHYHLVHLAKGVRLGKCGFEILKNQMLSWIEANPYLVGINWSDSLDIAIRLFNWNMALSIAGEGGDDSEFLFKVQKSICEQADFIEKHLSLFSSANNHLLGEYIGLLITGLCHPKLPKARHWFLRGKNGIEIEVLKQWGPDGVHREQSMSYHRWLLEHLLIIYQACKHVGQQLSSELEDRLRLGLKYVAQSLNVEGEVPFFGDCGHEVTTDMHYMSFKSTNCWVSLLRLGRLLGLYHGAYEEAWMPDFDERTCWIVSNREKKYGTSKNSRRKSKPFNVSGIFFLRDERRFDKENCIAFRCGPMGYLNTYAHAHADQLSFVLSVMGKQLLVDPGTYGYYFKGDKWRHYFRGTSSHNTVRVDNLDQAESGGNMMWIGKADGQLLEWRDDDEEVFVKGTHNGYNRLTDPVTHIRKIKLLKLKNRIEIKDQMRCNDEHVFDFFFHFHPDAHIVTISSHLFLVNRGESKIYFSLDQSLSLVAFMADQREPSGWYSPFFGTKLPCFTLRGRFKGEGNRDFDFVIEM